MVKRMYRVNITEKADSQMRELALYIAEESGSNEVALKYIGKMEKSIEQLIVFPEAGSVPRNQTIKKQGYRVLVVEKHLVFYKFNKAEGEVTIYAVVDYRREYQFIMLPAG
ncbi:toxin ParE1/3/4 [Lachnospiraceae bacterium PF1-21]|uniref:Type II toxin-antitoxin system RelE/ParE family toxin n=1 Tax=Ohessyouella blattaphilus TaxID=2949333 RepID=A0ABT1EG84_9FIRM|nr:type II toxin-antitoxin system RelE/ParE family toxin [Ohessyouella blattaphilus]MCP1109663.1 type II toxin-antitoxin system RelE/ParE family toxin [Ohessyouella blattaphilus]MCR8563057.1 type II toxin-antitoxin system RelE/ParE family toxin [Ohessyouella blattaphilus]MDL2251139.1 type II toxin-antitoxin system RelE/ParE family toxin [Lachnospiraceae bacterium OttesenSCG-928-J05]